MPFLVRVEEINGTVQPGRFLNAKDLGRQEEGADFQMVLIDETTNEIVVPNGTMGDRHTNPQKWNLRLENRNTGAKIDPRLSVFDQREDVTVVKFAILWR